MIKTRITWRFNRAMRGQRTFRSRREARAFWRTWTRIWGSSINLRMRDV